MCATTIPITHVAKEMLLMNKSEEIGLRVGEMMNMMMILMMMI
jgi:hypothetical protein